MQRQLRHVFGRNMSGTHLIAAGFGDIPILAKEAAHIAAGGAHAEDTGAGQEMIQGLLLDRVNLESGGSTVAEIEELSILVDADEAEARLAVANVAVART